MNEFDKILLRSYLPDLLRAIAYVAVVMVCAAAAGYIAGVWS